MISLLIIAISLILSDAKVVIFLLLYKKKVVFLFFFGNPLFIITFICIFAPAFFV